MWCIQIRKHENFRIMKYVLLLLCLVSTQTTFLVFKYLTRNFQTSKILLFYYTFSISFNIVVSASIKKFLKNFKSKNSRIWIQELLSQNHIVKDEEMYNWNEKKTLNFNSTKSTYKRLKFFVFIFLHIFAWKNEPRSISRNRH